LRHHRVITDTLTQPAAGADLAFIPAGPDKVRLLAVTARLTTSAAAGNRRPAIALSDKSAGVFWSADAIQPQAASLAVRYSWARGVGAQVASAIVTAERVALQLPDLWLQPQDTVETITLGIDTADQWDQIVWRGVVGDEWETERELYSLGRLLLMGQGG
jgi:hypothetical protein